MQDSSILIEKMTQADFGELVGISQQAVSDLKLRGVLVDGESGHSWVLSYCAHLREVAAGRATEGGIDLATERAALARAQRERIEMQNAVTRGELAPVSAMEMVLAAVGVKVGKILDTIPGTIRRRAPGIGAEILETITQDIAKCRNMAASMTLDELADEDEAEDMVSADMAGEGPHEP